MPIYEYECQQCRKVTEAMQRFSDTPLTACPACSGELKKLISHSSFHLKGSGWYVTDYARNGSAAPAAKKESPAESKPATSENAATPTPAAAAKTDAP